MQDSLPRPLANGRYELAELLGRGGAAKVYRARDRLLDVERAIKILAEGLREHYLERFLSEARAMALLQHPHVVTIYDVGTTAQDDYIVMELCRGGSLSGRIKANGTLPAKEAVRISVQTLSALSVLHAENIVHRDVKPSNVLLTETGQAKIADFGIALLQRQDGYRTEPGTAMGTRSFMPPEQRLDAHSVGPQADLYAVATSLYAITTGESPIDLAYARPHSDRWLRVSQDLRAALQHACALTPEDRPDSARDMAVELMTAIGMHESEQASWLQHFHGEAPRLSPVPVTVNVDSEQTPTVLPRRSFTEVMRLRADALQRAEAALERGEDVTGTVRRVAHAVAGSADDRGLGDIRKLAGAVAQAEGGALRQPVAALREAILSMLAEATVHKSVLVIEDDTNVSRILQMAANRHADEVEVAANASTARAHLAASHPSLVLLDLFLPDDDGREVLLWMREQPHLREVPVVVISGRASEQVRSECLALGADDLLPKPVDLGQLDEVIKKRLALSTTRVDEDRERFLAHYQRLTTQYERHRTPFAVGLVIPREEEAVPNGLAPRLRSDLHRHLPEAVTASSSRCSPSQRTPCTWRAACRAWLARRDRVRSWPPPAMLRAPSGPR